MTKEIVINKKKFTLNVEEAIKTGVLKEQNPLKNHNFQPGDVFVHPTEKINRFILVSATYRGIMGPTQKYQLLHDGLYINSGSFFETPRSINEIVNYLTEQGMVFKHNINAVIRDLMYG